MARFHTSRLAAVPRRWSTPSLLASLVALMHGCGVGLSPLDAPSRERIDHAEAWRAEIRAREYRSDIAASRESVGEPRTAEEFVALALARNPSIRAAEARVQRLAERVPQARSLDDPTLMVAPVGEMAETAAGQVGLMTSVSQRLPLPSKLNARERIAELEAMQAEAELQQVRLQVAADTRRAYWTYFFVSRAIETTGRSRALLVQFRDVADAQFRAGQRNQQDVLRAAAELGSLDTELSVLAQRRETAAAMLRRLINAPATQALPDPEPTNDAEVAVQRDVLLAQAARTNPAILRVSERMEQFEERQRLANLDRWPDLTLSLAYNVVDDEGLSPVANGRDQWWLGFGINVPLWTGRLNAAEREALYGRLETASELAAERDRVSFRVEDALLRLESQREVLRLLREEVLPDARGAVDAAAASYRSGAGDFLTLVDNWRRLLSYEVMEHRVVASVEQALADLQEAVGGDIDRATGDLRDDGHPEDAAASNSTDEESDR